MTNVSIPGFHLRSAENTALDAAVFHYTVYRALTRFPGLVRYRIYVFCSGLD